MTSEQTFNNAFRFAKPERDEQIDTLLRSIFLDPEEKYDEWCPVWGEDGTRYNIENYFTDPKSRNGTYSVNQLHCESTDKEHVILFNQLVSKRPYFLRIAIIAIANDGQKKDHIYEFCPDFTILWDAKYCEGGMGYGFRYDQDAVEKCAVQIYKEYCIEWCPEQNFDHLDTIESFNVTSW